MIIEGSTHNRCRCTKARPLLNRARQVIRLNRHVWPLVLTWLCTTGLFVDEACAGQTVTLGARDAIEQALLAAVGDATQQLFQDPNDGLDSVTIMRLRNDPNGVASAAVEYYVIRAASLQGIRTFSCAYPDKGTLPGALDKSVGGGARRPDIIVEGELLYARLDDSGMRAQAGVRLQLIHGPTGQALAAGLGRAVVPIKIDTFLLGLSQRSGFWSGLIASTAIVLAAAAANLPLLRQILLAAKPRYDVC